MTYVILVKNNEMFRKNKEKIKDKNRKNRLNRLDK